MTFDDVRFPTRISRGATGGPERRTEIVVLGSGAEERNSRWADSRRRYEAGFGIASLDDIHEVVAFFEERRGRLHGFRWKDHADFKSCPPLQQITPVDQVIATGDGERTAFQLVKTYGGGARAYARVITKPVAESLRIAVDGVEADFALDAPVRRGDARCRTRVGRGGDGRLRLRRAGALRYRHAAHQPRGLPGRRGAADPRRGDPRMRALPAGLQDHLDTGVTTLCRCWRLTTMAGEALGFTDHDRNLSFDGIVFAAEQGFTASEMESALGLSVDNLDAAGALSSDRLSEARLLAGDFDNAVVEVWLVNWQDVAQRLLLRKGHLGEVRFGTLGFTAELRGLSHVLNQEKGRVYRHGCDAVLGDARCGVDLANYSTEAQVLWAEERRRIGVSGAELRDDGWFARGTAVFCLGRQCRAAGRDQVASRDVGQRDRGILAAHGLRDCGG